MKKLQQAIDLIGKLSEGLEDDVLIKDVNDFLNSVGELTGVFRVLNSHGKPASAHNNPGAIFDDIEDAKLFIKYLVDDIGVGVASDYKIVEL